MASTTRPVDGGPIGRLRALYDAFQILIHEMLKFGVVGVLGVIIDVGLFNLARHFAVGPLTSKAISTTTAAVISYFLNRNWSFRHLARSGTGRELVVFLVLSAVGLGIAEGCLAISHYALGYTSTLDDNISANGFGLVLGTLWRFWSFKRWVFLPVSGNVGDTEIALRAAV